MDLSRGPENTRTDLIDVWSSVEAALRLLVGNMSASGQALIGDARARQLLTFDQGNSLVAFLVAREQLDRPDYQPTETDVNTARSSFLKLDAGLMSADAVSASAAAQAGPPASQIVPPTAGMEPLLRGQTVTRSPNVTAPWTIGIVLVLVVAAPVAIFLFGRRGGDPLLSAAIRAYESGDRVTAASTFERAARAAPNDALPHVYLARMAREVGNHTIANQELQLALKTEPGNLAARREYGAYFLSQLKYDEARVWYTHALEIDPNDATSQGWLGCALIKLGRSDEGMRFLSRAGDGAWSACRAVPLPAAPGLIRR